MLETAAMLKGAGADLVLTESYPDPRKAGRWRPAVHASQASAHQMASNIDQGTQTPATAVHEFVHETPRDQARNLRRPASSDSSCRTFAPDRTPVVGPPVMRVGVG